MKVRLSSQGTARTIDFDVTGNGTFIVYPDVTMTNGHDIETDFIAAGGSLKGTADSILKTNEIASIKNTNAFIDVDIEGREFFLVNVEEGSGLTLNKQTTIPGPEGTTHPLIDNGILADVDINVLDLATLILPQGNTINSLRNSIVQINGGHFTPLRNRSEMLTLEDSDLKLINIIDYNYKDILITAASSLTLSNASLGTTAITIQLDENNLSGSLRLDNNSSITILNDINATRGLVSINESNMNIGGHFILNNSSLVDLSNASLTVGGNMTLEPPINSNSALSLKAEEGTLIVNGDLNLESTISSVLGVLAKFLNSTISTTNFNLSYGRFDIGELESPTSMHVHGDLDLGTRGFMVLARRSTLIVDGEFEVSGGIVGGWAQISGTANIGNLDVNWGGRLSGNGTINGLVIQNNGLVAPGESPGTLTINGDYTQSETGTLEIEIFGSEIGTEYDQLVVNGTATLAGTLYIAPHANFPAGSQFEPLVATNVVGSFDRVVVETESARSSYLVSNTGTAVQIEPQTLSISTFTEYQNALFSDADVADESIGLKTSDPDGDQFSNLLEYAMDLNPWVGNDNPMIVEFEPDEVEGFSAVRVTFPWGKDMTDVDYVIQVSPDMSTWTDLTSTLQDTVDQGTHDLLTVGATINPPATERLFMRILVTENEL